MAPNAWTYFERLSTSYGGFALALLGWPCEQHQQKKRTHVVSQKSLLKHRRELSRPIYTGSHVSKIQLWHLATKQEMKQVLHIESLPGDMYVAKFLLRM